MEPESTEHNHTRGDARDRDDAWRGAFHSARSRTPWVVALFSFGSLFTSRFFASKLQFGRLFKRSPINGTIFQTIFPYRGEAWGTWSQVTYLNQRHFASAIGILLLVLVFLVMRYRAVAAKRAEHALLPAQPSAQLNGLPDIGAHLRFQLIQVPADVREPQVEMPTGIGGHTQSTDQEPRSTAEPFHGYLATVHFFGRPCSGSRRWWNSAVFLAAAADSSSVVPPVSLRGLQMLALAVTAGVIALPQMLLSEHWER